MLLLTTSACPCLKNSRNLGTILLPGPVKILHNFRILATLPSHYSMALINPDLCSKCSVKEPRKSLFTEDLDNVSNEEEAEGQRDFIRPHCCQDCHHELSREDGGGPDGHAEQPHRQPHCPPCIHIIQKCSF